MEAKDNIVAPDIEQGIRLALKEYEAKNTDNSLSDIYIHCDDQGSVFIYDDTENLLAEVTIGQSHDRQSLSRTIRSILQNLEKEGIFNKDYIYKPFTVNFVDKNFIVTEELLFLDDDTLKLDGSLWTDIEKELDDFIKELLK